MSTVSLICAAAENMAIGAGGKIPWHISADFRYFKSVTLGHTVIMGRGTWDSMGGKPLPGRRNIVVSRSLAGGRLPGAEIACSIEDALRMAEGEAETFIIGGGSLYRQAIDSAQKIYLTLVHTVVEDADTFFPEIGPQWRETSRSGIQFDEKSNLSFEFITYEK